MKKYEGGVFPRKNTLRWEQQSLRNVGVPIQDHTVSQSRKQLYFKSCTVVRRHGV